MSLRRRTPEPRPKCWHKLKWRKCAGWVRQMDATLPPRPCRISRRGHDAMARSSAAGMDSRSPTPRIAHANARLCVAAVATCAAFKRESD